MGEFPHFPAAVILISRWPFDVGGGSAACFIGERL